MDDYVIEINKSEETLGEVISRGRQIVASTFVS